MKLLESLRKNLFWTVDFLRGGRIRRHLNDIRFLQTHYNSAEAVARQNSSLVQILEHAANTVPYYGQLSGRLALENFPVIEKTDLRDNFDRFKSQSFLDKKNHKVSTSGSTGIPFEIYHDKNKQARNTADTIYFGKKTGFEIGARLYYLRLWDKQYKKSRFLSWLQNIDMQSVDDLSEQDIAKWLQKFELDTSSKSILGYNSALKTICSYLDAKNASPLNTKTNSVIAMAEALDDYVKQGIRKYFNTEAISRYSNSENGILAQQNYGSTHFEINWSSYYVEILDLNNNIPVEEGDLGRIVITDLYNYCMPMIRYDTGDVGRMARESDGRLVFTKIEGRKMDMFTNTKGEYVSSHIIHHILQFDEIQQFQFIEEENSEYIIKIKVSRQFDLEKEKRLIQQYSEYFGADAHIKIEYVNDIPLLLSGKRKLVINNAMQKYNRSNGNGSIENSFLTESTTDSKIIQ